MKIYFVTPTLLSYLDLTTMGGSEKRGDETKIGTFASGLKYAIAILLRNNAEISFKVVDSIPTGWEDIENRDRTTLYSCNTVKIYDEDTGKEKELISISKDVSLQSFFSQFCEDLEGGDLDTEHFETGFSVELGFNWKPWMALREIYSNMLDEGGYYTFDKPSDKYGTVTEIDLTDSPELLEVWENRHLYFNESEPQFEVREDLELLENPEGYLRIYKQNILVHEDLTTNSLFSYNIKFGELDERRSLLDPSAVNWSIITRIAETKNEEFLDYIIRGEKWFETDEEQFLQGSLLSSYYLSEAVKNKLIEKSFEGDASTFKFLIDAFKTDKNCPLPGRKISTISDSMWSASKTVVVEESKASIEYKIEEEQVKEGSLKSLIESHYNIKLECDVIYGNIKGSQVVADKFNKCIILKEDFDIGEDFYLFLVEYVDLTQSGNVLYNLAKELTKKIKK